MGLLRARVANPFRCETNKSGTSLVNIITTVMDDAKRRNRIGNSKKIPHSAFNKEEKLLINIIRKAINRAKKEKRITYSQKLSKGRDVNLSEVTEITTGESKLEGGVENKHNIAPDSPRHVKIDDLLEQNEDQAEFCISPPLKNIPHLHVTQCFDEKDESDYESDDESRGDVFIDDYLENTDEEADLFIGPDFLEDVTYLVALRSSTTESCQMQIRRYFDERSNHVEEIETNDQKVEKGVLASMMCCGIF